MIDESAQILAGICLLTEVKLLEEFKSKPEFKKRTSEALAETIGLDKSLVEFILLESSFFESCDGCKGSMWKLIEEEE